MREIVDIKEIQKIALEVMVFVDKICRRENIKYSLAGGTLIGAIRHKGFIPWDDDIDIIMTRQEYDKFLAVMDKEENGQFKNLHYGPEFPNYFYRFSKVIDLSTSLQERELIMHKDMGIYVDVFPADNIIFEKRNKIIKKSVFYSRMLEYSFSKKLVLKNKGLKKSILLCFAYPIAKIFGPYFWRNKAEKLMLKYNSERTDYLYPHSGCYRERDVLKKEYFDELIDVEFEGYKFLAFKKYDEYLRHVFGDYMKLPPKEKQVPHHDCKIFKK